MSEMMDEKIFKALKELLNYIRKEEQRNYEELVEEPGLDHYERNEVYKRHIYSHICILDKFVKEIDPDDNI